MGSHLSVGICQCEHCTAYSHSTVLRTMKNARVHSRHIAHELVAANISNGLMNVDMAVPLCPFCSETILIVKIAINTNALPHFSEKRFYRSHQNWKKTRDEVWRAPHKKIEAKIVNFKTLINGRSGLQSSSLLWLNIILHYKLMACSWTGHKNNNVNCLWIIN